MGGTPSHYHPKGTFSVTLKCYHESEENFSVTLNRDSVTDCSYETDAILTGLESWADTVATLA